MPEQRADAVRARHTLGPWEAEAQLRTGNDGGKHGYFEITSRDGMFWIARVLGFSTGTDVEEYRHNARLIAAAPDLLKALWRARDCLMCCAIDTAGTPTEQTFLDEVRICDEAIDKAAAK